MNDLQPNELFAERYRLRKQLGQGGFSETWLAHNEMAGCEQVIKIFNVFDDKGLRIFQREFTRANHLNHNRLLRASNFDVFENRPYEVLPFYGRGSVWRLVGKLGEREIARVMRDIGGALAYIHQPAYRMVHRDIKPGNILLSDQGHYVLSDFSITKELREEFFRFASQNGHTINSGSGISPPAYRAPECFRPKEEGAAVMASDIWAFGAILYEMAAGHPPFGEDGVGERFSGHAPPALPSSFSWQLNAILKDCMAKSPGDRPSAEALRQMAEEYLNSGHWPVNFFSEKSQSWKKFDWAASIEWIGNAVSAMRPERLKGINLAGAIAWVKRRTNAVSWIKGISLKGLLPRLSGLEWSSSWKPWLKRAGLGFSLIAGFLLAVAAILVIPKGNEEERLAGEKAALADTTSASPNTPLATEKKQKGHDTITEIKEGHGPFRNSQFEEVAEAAMFPAPDSRITPGKREETRDTTLALRSEHGPFRDIQFETAAQASATSPAADTRIASGEQEEPQDTAMESLDNQGISRGQLFEEIAQAGPEREKQPGKNASPPPPANPEKKEIQQPSAVAVKQSGSRTQDSQAASLPPAPKKTENPPAARQSPAPNPSVKEKATEPKPRFNELTGKWGYVDNAGNWVIWPQFDQATIFIEGKAMVVKIGNNDRRRSYFIDLNGKLTPVSGGEPAEEEPGN